MHRELAESLWREAPEGASIVSEGNGRRTTAHKDKKMVVIVENNRRVDPEYEFVQHEITAVAWPKPEHMDALNLARRSLIPNRYSPAYESGLGIVQLACADRLPSPPIPQELTLKRVQGFYRSIRTPKSKNKAWHGYAPEQDRLALPAGLSNYYHGWRVRCLRVALAEAFQHADRVRVVPELLHGLFERQNPKRRTQFECDLVIACRQLGLRMKGLRKPARPNSLKSFSLVPRSRK